MAVVVSACPICGARDPKITGREHVDSGTKYTHHECGSCRVQFWSPLKNPGAEWYRNHEKYGNRSADPVWNATWNHKKTLSFLEDTKGAVLDVGCGIGNFLVEAKRKGWDIAGIDFDTDAIGSAKKITGVDDFEPVDVVTYARTHPSRKFELVTFFDVLEHVDDHNEFISSVKSLLKPGGYIAMSMPYREHAIWLMRADVPPMHLTCWDRESLRRFLTAHGFDVVYMRRGPATIWDMVMKLRFKYGKSVSFGAVSAVRKRVDDRADKPGERPFSVRIVHALAKTKDAIFFGIPATLIWLAMVPTRKRYIDLFAIARLR